RVKLVTGVQTCALPICASNLRYAVSARLFDDADPNETFAANDTRDAGTPLAASVDQAGAVHYSATGQITWWDYIDGKTTAELASDRKSVGEGSRGAAGG